MGDQTCPCVTQAGKSLLIAMKMTPRGETRSYLIIMYRDAGGDRGDSGWGKWKPLIESFFKTLSGDQEETNQKKESDQSLAYRKNIGGGKSTAFKPRARSHRENFGGNS